MTTIPRGMAVLAGQAALALLVTACSSGNPATGSDAGGLFTCDEDTDCDDGAACTVDTCVVGGTCSFMPVDALCEDGESCLAGRGCVAGTPCDDAADCDDAIACTIDSCGVDRMCRHMAFDDLCDDPAAPSCDPAMGCVRGSGCTSAAECDDSIACTVDACGADMTCRHTPVNGECATGEVCSLTMGCYTPRPCTTAAECDDGIFCNGVEQCVPEFGCAEAAAPRACSDSEACTVDSCDTSLDQCVFRCDPTLGATCAAMCPAPTEGCNGRFTVTGTTSFGCNYMGILDLVRVDASELTFTTDADGMTIRPRAFMTMPTPPGGLVYSDDVPPSCPDFDASAVVNGDATSGCIEYYRVHGSFSDDDHFTGTVEWRYEGSILEPGDCTTSCPGGSGPISGTRVP